MKKVLTIAAAALLLALPVSAADIYVSKTTGSNGNDGTKEAPKKLLNKVMGDLKEGDRVFVAEGVYNGKKKLGVMPKITVSNVVIEGGWKADFSERDPFKYLSIITGVPDKQADTHEVFQCEGPTDVTIDGFCIDRGPALYYFAEGEMGANKKIEGHVDNTCWGFQALNKKKGGSDPAIELLGKGSFTVRNCILVNNPWWGIYVKGGGSGTVTIENNFVLSYQGRGIEAISGGGWAKGVTYVIRNNTVAFGHAMEGRALSMDPRGNGDKYVVENNVLCFGDQTGFMTKFGAKSDNLTLNNNLFYFFIKGDAGDGGSSLCQVDEFEDELDCNNEGNVHEMPKFVAKIEPAWFDRYSTRVGMTGSYTTDDELMAARKSCGLGDYHPPTFETYPSNSKLPKGIGSYVMSRYPKSFKKGEELMDWTKSILPMLGQDGERGIQATFAKAAE